MITLVQVLANIVLHLDNTLSNTSVIKIDNELANTLNHNVTKLDNILSPSVINLDNTLAH